MNRVVCVAVLVCGGCAMPGPYTVFTKCPDGASVLKARVRGSGAAHVEALRAVCDAGATRTEAYRADAVRPGVVVTEQAYSTHSPNTRIRSGLYLERRQGEILPRFEFFYVP